MGDDKDADVPVLQRPSQPSGSRVFDQQDADAFAVALDRYTAANTASVEAARKKLQELGIFEADGRLTEDYR